MAGWGMRGPWGMCGCLFYIYIYLSAEWGTVLWNQHDLSRVGALWSAHINIYTLFYIMIIIVLFVYCISRLYLYATTSEYP